MGQTSDQHLAVKDVHKSSVSMSRMTSIGIHKLNKWSRKVPKRFGSTNNLLIRMCQMGVDQKTIATYWKSEGLCYLEYCSPVYNGALTKQQERDLARVHRRAVTAITGVHTRGEEFKETCQRLGLEDDLSQRRLRLPDGLPRRAGTRISSQGWTTPTTQGMGGRSGGTQSAAPSGT